MQLLKQINLIDVSLDSLSGKTGFLAFTRGFIKIFPKCEKTIEK
jgi:hypothetical protein